MVAIYRPSVLRFCIDVLRYREANDRGHAWLWQIKRHVAEHCLSMQNIMAAVTPAEREDGLTADERVAILRSHSLLHDPRAETCDSLGHRGTKWFMDLQRRAAAYGDEHRTSPSL